MAKRRKKFKEKKSFLNPKKIRRWLMRLGLVAAGIAVGVLWKPSLIQNATQRAQVEGVRTQILEANGTGQEAALKALGASAKNAKDVVGKVSQITKEVTHTDPQVLVDEKVSAIKEEVKSLPEKQVKRIKLEFCKDVIEEIQLSCKSE